MRNSMPSSQGFVIRRRSIPAPFRALILGILLLPTSTVFAAAATRPAMLTVAILDFDAATTPNPEIGKQIGEALTTMLTGEEGFTLVDRASISKILTELELNQTGLISPQNATKLGQLVGARILITGKAFMLDKKMYLTAKIIGTETSQVEGLLVKGDQQYDLGKLVSDLSVKLATRVREAGPRLVAGPLSSDDPTPALIAKLKQMKLPVVAVSITERHIGVADRRIDPAVETEIRALLLQAGFTIAEGDEKDLAKAGVDVVIGGEAFSEFAARIGNLVSCSARIEITIHPRAGENILYSDRETARAADLSEQLAGKSALQKGGRAVGIRILEHFAKQSGPAKDKR